jgi:hypothetical protein
MALVELQGRLIAPPPLSFAMQKLRSPDEIIQPLVCLNE